MSLIAPRQHNSRVYLFELQLKKARYREAEGLVYDGIQPFLF